MASGGEVRLQYEEAPASFKSVVWRHFGFAVEYNAEEEKKRTEIIPDLYEKTCNSIVYELAQAQSLALTTDGWTSRATVSYLTVTVHYMSDWEMKSAVLQTRPLYESHTSAHLAEELTNPVNTWKLRRPNMLLPVTTDNAPNIVNAVNEADGLGPQISCFAHVNLAAKKAVSINTGSRLLGRVKKTVTFFHKSTKAHHVLTVKQEMLNLPKVNL
ncbi:E3 SUMO-protein ligase ZBED1-like [Tachysurus ichikawai]